MNEISLLAAVGGGVVSLLAPCSALLLPSFFAYAFGSTRALVAHTWFFLLGLLLTLVPLGLGAGALSTLLVTHRGAVITVAGWVLVVVGVAQVVGLGFALPGVDRLQARWQRMSGSGALSTVLLGAVYGLAGFCSGPVLGAILTVAATSGSPWLGGALLAAYGLGMVAPLFLLAVLWDRFGLARRGWLRPRPRRIGPVTVHPLRWLSGGFFIAVGVLFLVFDGSAGALGGLGLADTTELEFNLQQRITEIAAAVPAWVVPALVLVAALVWLVRRARAVPNDEPDAPAAGEPAEAPEVGARH